MRLTMRPAHEREPALGRGEGRRRTRSGLSACLAWLAAALVCAAAAAALPALAAAKPKPVVYNARGMKTSKTSKATSWSAVYAYADFTVNAGDEVTFVPDSLPHTVSLVRTLAEFDSCNVQSPPDTTLATFPGQSKFTLSTSQYANQTLFVVCNVHCGNGMKFKLTVRPKPKAHKKHRG